MRGSLDQKGAYYTNNDLVATFPDNTIFVMKYEKGPGGSSEGQFNVENWTNIAYNLFRYKPNYQSLVLSRNGINKTYYSTLTV